MAIELLNTSAVAELTGLKKATLISLRKKGLGPVCKQVGREYLYDKETTEAWLKSLFAVAE